MRRLNSPFSLHNFWNGWTQNISSLKEKNKEEILGPSKRGQQNHPHNTPLRIVLQIVSLLIHMHWTQCARFVCVTNF